MGWECNGTSGWCYIIEHLTVLITVDIGTYGCGAFMFKFYLYLLSNSPSELSKLFMANIRARANYHPSNIEIIQLEFQGPCSLLK